MMRCSHAIPILMALLGVTLGACHGCKREEARPAPEVVDATSAVVARLPDASVSLRDAATADASAASDAGKNGRLVRGAQEPEAFCAIFGTFPEGQEAQAQKLQKAVEQLGVSSLEVKSTSELRELAWGQLVVLAELPTRAEAEAAVAKGKPAAKGFVKGCSPVSGAQGGQGASAASVDVDENTDGCVGWNPAKGTAACITGTSSIQGGEDTKAQFFGGSDLPWLVTPRLTFDAKVDAKHIDAVKRALDAGGYLSLKGERVRKLFPGEEAVWASPRFTVRYERRQQPDVETSLGSWPLADDHLEIDCAGKKTALVDRTVEGVTSAEAHLFWAPKQHLLLVQWKYLFGMEGDSGGATVAHLLAIDALCAP